MDPYPFDVEYVTKSKCLVIILNSTFWPTHVEFIEHNTNQTNDSQVIPSVCFKECKQTEITYLYFNDHSCTLPTSSFPFDSNDGLVFSHQF